jgi:tRNA pseudouridine32 synthase/23S rRNA pseudouridine746 synthase
VPAETELTVIHVDEWIVVVDKSGGLLAVPGRGPDRQDCVVRRVREMIPDCMEQPAVHRLDQATSGLMVLALESVAHRRLSREFAERRVDKRYIALLEGVVAGQEGEIRLRFRLDPDNRPHQVYDPEQGRTGVTRWRKLETTAGRTRVEFIPLTGRTHQLRLHAAHPLGLGCPIVGDSLYGSGRRGDPMFLHARELVFIHPATGKRMRFTSPVPF